MKMTRTPAVPAAYATNPVTPVQPVAKSRRVPQPQPKPHADAGGAHTVTTGRGAVRHKPHNPDNHLAAMPSAAPKGAPVKGYRNGGMVKGGKY